MTLLCANNKGADQPARAGWSALLLFALWSVWRLTCYTPSFNIHAILFSKADCVESYLQNCMKLKVKNSQSEKEAVDKFHSSTLNNE